MLPNAIRPLSGKSLLEGADGIVIRAATRDENPVCTTFAALNKHHNVVGELGFASG